LYQEDARLSPEDRVRAAVAACAARHGRPGTALVHAGDHAWPPVIDGVRVEPSPTIPYPTYILLTDTPMEEPHATATLSR
jgi:hypothetical protein